MQSYVSTIPPRKLWKEKKTEERVQEERLQVSKLEEWERIFALDKFSRMHKVNSAM